MLGGFAQVGAAGVAFGVHGSVFSNSICYCKPILVCRFLEGEVRDSYPHYFADGRKEHGETKMGTCLADILFILPSCFVSCEGWWDSCLWHFKSAIAAFWCRSQGHSMRVSVAPLLAPRTLVLRGRFDHSDTV